MTLLVSSQSEPYAFVTSVCFDLSLDASEGRPYTDPGRLWRPDTKEPAEPAESARLRLGASIENPDAELRRLEPEHQCRSDSHSQHLPGEVIFESLPSSEHASLFIKSPNRLSLVGLSEPGPVFSPNA
jgi:hypothetical protein